MINVRKFVFIKIIFWAIILMDYRIEKIFGKTPPSLYLPNLSENNKLHPITIPIVPNCKNTNFLNQPYLCKFVNQFKKVPPVTSNSIFSPQDYLTDKPTNRQGRSYYGSYGHGAPSAPTFYPTFDPISVLASLAFLAFLLQSFASLFDRSRSIIPTIISSRRHSSSEVDEDVEERVMRALNEYSALENNLFNQREETTTKFKPSAKR
ncbi:uncharacterized protein LOC122497795 isoform X2 [Leptopilina heterotoma]|uniref:uncharacterized protein LOC122497795 isoform X2 n=1 Tax=Leptopilina heterotoma TaxID=63436 RepID=UPI001CA8D833|nr:uncharacterized protein LOC122497795 isoform X2 [Leptopilina heterotoma]